MGTKARKNNFIPKHIFLTGSVPSDFVPKRAFIRSTQTPSDQKKEEQNATQTIPLTNIRSHTDTFDSHSTPNNHSVGFPSIPVLPHSSEAPPVITTPLSASSLTKSPLSDSPLITSVIPVASLSEPNFLGIDLPGTGTSVPITTFSDSPKSEQPSAEIIKPLSASNPVTPAGSSFPKTQYKSHIEMISDNDRAAILPFSSLVKSSNSENFSEINQENLSDPKKFKIKNHWKTSESDLETADVTESSHSANVVTEESVTNELETVESSLLPVKEQEDALSQEDLPSWLQPAFQFAAQKQLPELTDLSPEEEWLSRILGRPLTSRDRELFYWEDYVESQDESDGTVSKVADEEFLPKSIFLATCYSGVEYLGSCILTTWRTISRIFFAIPNKTTANEENNKVFPKKRKFYLSDMMISIITGVCIATFIVFPLLRVVGEEVFYVVAKSVVRHMGEKVSLNAMGSDATLLPILSEQFIFPKMENSEGGAEVIKENETIIPLE